MDALWRRRSIRAQLLIVVALADFIALLTLGTAAIFRVRAQTRIEVAASMRLAEVLLGDVVNLTHLQRPAEQFLSSLPNQLRSIRHIRVTVKDAAGVPVAATPSGESGSVDRASAPDFVISLVAPASEKRVLPIVADGARVGEVEIAGEPGDEIAEFWHDAVDMGVFVFLLNFAMIGIFYVLFGRVLNPLTALVRGLSELRGQNYRVRLSEPHASELGAITDHFNTLAGALEVARADNLRLSRQLITAQDDERRRTALELHDEFGPCFFGLEANASSIGRLACSLPDRERQAIVDRINDINAIVHHLQAINQSMLARLRPMALGHVPLKEILDQFILERARQYSQISFSYDAPEILASYGDTIDLTVYRFVQEGVSNAIRHAQAQHIAVELALAGNATQLVLTVRDDGRGIHPEMAAGYGLRGMQERVAGLGGSYTINSEAGQGTCLRVTVPLYGPKHTVPEAMGSKG
jgi:two-component system, NarL family, sensor histidine kinase UhpB